MKKKIKSLKIRINNQDYLNKIIKKYPEIKSIEKQHYDLEPEIIAFKWLYYSEPVGTNPERLINIAFKIRWTTIVNYYWFEKCR